MKKFLSLILALALVLGLAACGSSPSSAPEESAGSTAEGASAPETSENTEAPAELTTVRAAVMTNGAMHWYAVIGDETGIFAQHGIQVEISEFAYGINTVDAIVTEQADIGNLADYAAVNRIGNTQDNTNLRIVSRISTSDNTTDGGLYVKPDEIKSVDDLAGKGLATTVGTVQDYWVAKTYEYAGIAEADQNIVNCDSAASAVALLISGQADAFWASGVEAAKLQEAGFEPILTLDDLGLYTDAYYIVPTTLLESDPGVVEAYLAASKEVADWVYANPDEAAAIIEQRLGVTPELFQSSLAATQLTIDFTYGTLDHLNGIKEWAVSDGRFADYEITDFTDLSALRAAVPDAEIID